ncbi:MAG: ATP-binding protein [Armatimonadota bacterium]|nr:ATP-binding protein [Armatimonadota bacterium]
MPAILKANWSDSPVQRLRDVYVSHEVAERAREGMTIYGSSIHPVGVLVCSAIPETGRPGYQIPSIPHDVVLSEDLRTDLETTVIEPTLEPEEGGCLVVATGPTGVGKTTAMKWAVNQIDQRCDGRLAYFDLPPGHFRDSLYGRSEAIVREVFATARELALEHGYRVFIACEDAEASLMQSRRWSQRAVSGCGDTAAATTSELLRGLKLLADDGDIAATFFTSSNYTANMFDPALMNESRLRDYITFAPLELSMVEQVVVAHTARWDAADGVGEWLRDALTADPVLARGRQGHASVEVRVADCLTPAMIEGVLARARRLAHRDTITVRHVARAYVRQFTQLSERIASQSHADIGMIVPKFDAAGDVHLQAVFAEETQVSDDAELMDVIVPA